VTRIELHIGQYGASGPGTKLLVDGVELHGCRRISFDIEAGTDIPVVEVELVAHELTFVGDDVKLLAAAGADFIADPDERRALLDVHRLRRTPLDLMTSDPAIPSALLPGRGSDARAMVSKYAALPDDVRLDIVESLDLGEHPGEYTAARIEIEGAENRGTPALDRLDAHAFGVAQQRGTLDLFQRAIDSATRNVAIDAAATFTAVDVLEAQSETGMCLHCGNPLADHPIKVRGKSGRVYTCDADEADNAPGVFASTPPADDAPNALVWPRENPGVTWPAAPPP
jgi:hypothetical protein